MESSDHEKELLWRRKFKTASVLASRRIKRAAMLTIDQNGFNIATLVIATLVGAISIVPEFKKGGWPAMMQLLQSGGLALSVVVGGWVLSFLYYLVWMPPETFPVSEIHKHAEGLVAAVSIENLLDTRPSPFGANYLRIGAGCRVDDEDGFITTCDIANAVTCAVHSVITPTLNGPTIISGGLGRVGKVT